jgi:hypothetical protein
MSRRPAVLPTSPRPFSRSSLFGALLHQSETHPLPFQPFAHSLCVYPGWRPERSPNSRSPLATRHSPLSSLKSTLVDDLRVLTEISRNWPPATPLESTLTRLPSITPLESALTKNQGGGRPYKGVAILTEFAFAVAVFGLVEEGVEGGAFEELAVEEDGLDLGGVVDVG